MSQPTTQTKGTATIGAFICLALAFVSFFRSTWDSAILSFVGVIIGAVAVFNNRNHPAAWVGLVGNLAVFALSVLLLIAYFVTPRSEASNPHRRILTERSGVSSGGRIKPARRPNWPALCWIRFG